MTASVAAALAGGFVVSVGAWVFMFRLDRRDIWPRTWGAAIVLSAYAVAACASLGRAATLVGRIDLIEVGLGVGVGATWLVATHVGAAIITRLVPAFGGQVGGLYRLADGDTVARMAGPVVAMAVAEELMFRGLIQGSAGIAVAIAAYGAVQVVEGKWALVLAAILGGAVWGALFAWRHGLVAPTLAHVVWTSTLVFVWPIPATEPAAPHRGRRLRPIVPPTGPRR